MQGHPSHPIARRILRLKAALVAVSLTLAGILLMMLAGWLDHLNLGTWGWLHSLPLGELGGTLFGAGLLSTLFEYAFRRDQEESTVERFRQTIRDEAPTLRDSVIEAFRFNRNDLQRIATPELLDDLARISLGLRFGDSVFGEEVYGDIKHQAITAEERWHDARVDATLGIPRVRGVTPNPFIDLTVRWEYTVTPKHRFRKFAVVSDRQRYEELVAQRGETSVWFRRPAPGFDVTDPAAFTLERFTVDGVDVAFERQADGVSQVYVVDLGDEAIRSSKPVVVAFQFCAAVPVTGHSFYLNIDRPTKGLDVELSYDPTAVSQVSLMDFASRGDGGRMSDEPGTSTLRYRYDGWLFPRAGLVFTWSLPNEHASRGVARRGVQQAAPAHHAKHAAASDDDTRQARTA